MAEENKSHRASGTTDAQNKFESSKTHARKAAEDLRDAAGAIAGEYRGKAELGTTLAVRLSKPGRMHGAKPSTRSAMRERARGRFKTMRKSTFAKIRPRQSSPRSAWDLSSD
jgi:hypothetical protein